MYVLYGTAQRDFENFFFLFWSVPKLVSRPVFHADSESGLRFCPGHCVHNEINSQKPGPAYAGFRAARADAVASSGPTRPQLAAARTRGIEKYNQYPYQIFENRVLENRENGLHAEFNSGCNPFVRILIPATQFERRIFFLKLFWLPTY